MSKNQPYRVSVLPLEEALRLIRGERTRTSKYDVVINDVKKMDASKALVVEGLRYTEVTALRNKVRRLLGKQFKIDAVKVDKEADGASIYQVTIYQHQDQD